MAQVRQLFGCEPDKFSTNVLNINPGSVRDFYGNREAAFPVEKKVDLTRNGLWGLDTGTPQTGNLFLYVLLNPATEEIGLMASQSTFMSGVVVPSGFQIERKLPWGVVYNAAWDGIPDFHLTHWPMPMITLTGAEDSGKWRAITQAAAPDWLDVDLSPWVPDNARFAHMDFECRYLSGSAGSCYVRSYGAQTVGRLVGSVFPAAPSVSHPIALRLTSDRKFQFKTTGDAKLTCYVLGYSMTEPA